MKTLTTMALLCLSTLFVKSQNLINQSESSIKDYMSSKGIDFIGKMYDKVGAPFLHFSYSVRSADGDGLIDSYYFLDDNSNCTSLFMLYSELRFLDQIVTALKSNPELEKVPDAFVWRKKDGSYNIKITENDNRTFMVAYSVPNSK